MKNIISILLLLIFGTHLWSQTITIFTIGDSTMSDKPLNNDNQERGWGQMLPMFFNDSIQINNQAVNGRSSKSFIDEGRWEKVLTKIKAGDYVFIQFGHNDAKPDEARHTQPGSTFDDNLRCFVQETRLKKGIPVLFNSIVRRNFNTEGVLTDTHGAYLDSPRNVAKEMNVPFIDMNQITYNLVMSMGVEDSKKLFMWIVPGISAACPAGREDNTHLCYYGAYTIAGLTINNIAKEVPALTKYICQKEDSCYQ